MMNKYKIIALIGESGSGKDTLLQSILSKNTNLNEIISSTTRPKREGEGEGVNYYYLTPEQFAYKVLNNEMIEATCFNDWFYGTTYEALRSDVHNIGVFNPAGIESLILDKNIDLTVYYIQATKKNRLLRQLNREENPNVDEIIRRYKTDTEDFLDLDFNYIPLVNNTPQDLENNVDFILGNIK